MEEVELLGILKLGQWPQRFMTTNFEPGIMSAICLPSSGVAVGSCDVQTTIVGALIELYCSAAIMFGRRISISCRYMIRFMVSVNPGWA